MDPNSRRTLPQHQLPPSSEPDPPEKPRPEVSRADTPLLNRPGPRLVFAGLLFASFSAFSTRRALVRRRTPIPVMPGVARAQLAQATKGQSIGRNKHPVAPPPAAAPGAGTTPSTHLGTAPIRPPGGVQGQAVGQTTASTQGVPVAMAGEATGGLTAPEAAQQAAEAAAPELHNSGAVLAVEALALASINVFAWGMTGVGAILWTFDIRSMDDLRRKVRGGLGIDGSGRTEQEVEEETEEWIVSVLARKESKERSTEIARNRDGRETAKNDRGRER